MVNVKSCSVLRTNYQHVLMNSPVPLALPSSTRLLVINMTDTIDADRRSTTAAPGGWSLMVKLRSRNPSNKVGEPGSRCARTGVADGSWELLLEVTSRVKKGELVESTHSSAIGFTDTCWWHEITTGAISTSVQQLFFFVLFFYVHIKILFCDQTLTPLS